PPGRRTRAARPAHQCIAGARRPCGAPRGGGCASGRLRAPSPRASGSSTSELTRGDSSSSHHARRLGGVTPEEHRRLGVESHSGEMEDWDLAGAHEALARAHLAASELAEASRHVELGRAEVAKIADPDDRKHIEADLDALPL